MFYGRNKKPPLREDPDASSVRPRPEHVSPTRRSSMISVKVPAGY